MTVDFVQDAVAFLSDAYWAIGSLVVLGGFVLFIAELISQRRTRERAPQVVSITTDQRSAVNSEPFGAMGGESQPRLQLEPPSRALPSGTAITENKKADDAVNAEGRQR